MKKVLSAVSIYLTIALVFFLLTFILPFPKTSAVWIAFGFGVLSIIAGMIITAIAFLGRKTLMSKFYGYPVFRIGYIYTAVQLIFAVIVDIVSIFVVIPTFIPLTVSILITAAAFIGLVVTDNARDIVKEIDHRERIVTKPVTDFYLDTSELLDLCRNEEIRMPLEKLVSIIRFSDPVSIPETKQKEKEIEEELEKLKKAVASDDTEESLGLIDSISALINARNRICEANK